VASLDADRLRAVSLAERGAGLPINEASWTKIPDADFIALIGADLYRTQPMLFSLVRKGIIERALKVAVIGKTDRLPPFAAFQFPVEDQKIPNLIKALRMEMTERLKKASKKAKHEVAKSAIQALLKEAGLSRQEKKAFSDMAEAFARSLAPLIMVGEGVTGLKSPTAFQDVLKLARVKGQAYDDLVPLVALKPFGNSAGARKIGLCGNGKTHKGKGGLVVLCQAHDLDLPFVADMEEPDFLAVISPYFPESLAGKAHVVIPKPLWMEENGSFTSLDGREASFKQKLIDPPEGVRSSWDILKDLADHAGFRPSFSSWDDLSRKAEKAISKPRSTLTPNLEGEGRVRGRSREQS
jgi:NADH dehydrogenase/NADH:ubiquinone oxidoreductase subunit G